MKKKIIIIPVIFILLASGTIYYLNKVVLPVKVKNLIIQGLEEATQQQVSLRNLKINIFKGLVLEGLALSDGSTQVVNIKEASCNFLIPPIFAKKIIIPFIRVDSPVIYLERRPDNTFNIAGLFGAPKQTPAAQPKFNLFIYKITVKDGRIDFKDSALTPEFTKTMDDLDLFISLSLPAGIKFKGRSGIPDKAGRMAIDLAGEFKIPQKQLTARLNLKGLSPEAFDAYYRKSGLSVLRGVVSALINIEFENNLLSVDVSAAGKDIAVSKDKIRLGLNPDIKANLQYTFINKELKFTGTADITDSEIAGLEVLDKIKHISGRINFDNSGMSSDKLSADIGGIALNAKASLKDFKNPLLNMEINSSLDLAGAQEIMQESFKFNLGASLQGKGSLYLKIETTLPSTLPLEVDGYLDISGATAKPERITDPIQNILGKVEFNNSGLNWSGLSFNFRNIYYETSGAMADFKSPRVKLALESSYLLLDSEFALKDKVIAVSKCEGKYLNSPFSLTGDIDIHDSANLSGRLKGSSDIELGDLKEIFKKSPDKLEKIKPRGTLHADLDLEGNLNKLKDCVIQLNLSSGNISIYGLNASDFSLEYSQAQGLADISMLRMNLYDGKLEATAKMNLNSDNLPWWLGANINGVKLERLKMDAPAKAKDISGTLQAEVKVNGFGADQAKASGAGKILIVDGKLWQLDLFKGMGSLIFVKDFANIVFSEASCTFLIQDKYVVSDNLKLKSSFVNLDGAAKIGFDGSIDSSVDIQVLDELAPISGTLKDLATVVIGSAGKLGVIKISGTLKEPKYKFKPAVVDIIKGLKDTFLGNIF